MWGGARGPYLARGLFYSTLHFATLHCATLLYVLWCNTPLSFFCPSLQALFLFLHLPFLHCIFCVFSLLSAIFTVYFVCLSDLTGNWHFINCVSLSAYSGNCYNWYCILCVNLAAHSGNSCVACNSVNWFCLICLSL